MSETEAIGAPRPAPGQAPPSGPPEGGRGAAPRPWGPGRVAGGIAVLLVLVVIESGIFDALTPDPLRKLVATLVLQAALALTLVAVSFTMASPQGGLAPGEVLGLRRWTRSPWGLAIGGFFVYIALSVALNSLLEPEQKDIARDLGFGKGDLANVAAGLLIVGAAPISEEIFFRGFIFGGLRTRLPFLVAAPISAVIFGLFHYGPGSIGVVIQLTIFGLVLAYLYERTQSLWPAIALHAFNNAIAFAILTS